LPRRKAIDLCEAGAEAVSAGVWFRRLLSGLAITIGTAFVVAGITATAAASYRLAERLFWLWQRGLPFSRLKRIDLANCTWMWVAGFICCIAGSLVIWTERDELRRWCKTAARSEK
jgi:hypothetical protein